jgi:hypothetical protein
MPVMIRNINRIASERGDVLACAISTGQIAVDELLFALLER